MEMAKYRFETDRLILRAWSLDDLDDFYAYARVDGVGQMAGWLPHKSPDESREILNHFIERKTTLAIFHKMDKKVIGSIELRDESSPLEEDKDLLNKNMGFVLSKDYWGQGLMPEAAGELIDFSFKNNFADNIYMGYFSSNSQSKRVQEKLGLRPVGEADNFFKVGRRHTVIMRITKKEWQEKNASL